jgi:hypothetical protein
MEASELLLKKAREYEILAASYAERASFDREEGRAAVGFTLAALVLRELAEVLDEAA